MAELTRDEKIELLKLLEERERRLVEATTGRKITAGMSAAPQGVDIQAMARQEVGSQAQQIENANPLANPAQLFRPREALPGVGAAAAAGMAPAAVIPQAIAGGLGYLAGESGRRALAGEPIDRTMLPGAGMEAALSGGGAMAAKGLGRVGQMFLGSGEPDQAARRAIAFARRNRLPLPASAGRDSIAADVLERAAGSTVAGDIAERSAANRAEDFIRQGIESARISPNKRPLEVAAQRGQQWLSDMLTSSKEAGSDAFNALKSAVGEETPVDAASVAATIRAQLARWDKAGLGAKFADDRNYKQLVQFSEEGGDVAFGDLESIRRAAQGLSKKAAAEERVWKGADMISDSVIDRYRALGNDTGIDVVGMLDLARQKTRLAGDLSRIKDAVRLSKPGAKPWTWLNDAVSNRELMGLLQKQNPQVYGEVLDGWLDNGITRWVKPGEPINGKALRDWFVRNKQTVRRLYGGKRSRSSWSNVPGQWRA